MLSPLSKLETDQLSLYWPQQESWRCKFKTSAWSSEALANSSQHASTEEQISTLRKELWDKVTKKKKLFLYSKNIFILGKKKKNTQNLSQPIYGTIPPYTNMLIQTIYFFSTLKFKVKSSSSSFFFGDGGRGNFIHIFIYIFHKSDRIEVNFFPLYFFLGNKFLD